MNKLFSCRRVMPGLIVVVLCLPVAAWEHHPVLNEALLAIMPEVAEQSPVEAVALEEFLLAVEGELEVTLAWQEQWAQDHLPWYKSRPAHLAFHATGNSDDIRERFFRAIRINPDTRTPLYLSRLTDVLEGERPGLAPEDVTLLPDSAGIERFEYLPVAPGDMVHPLDVVVTAGNEPDFGMDVGLFEDNDTPYGAEYGFGEQAFGDPSLDYGSQAPFHMGFYHESRLVFLFAGFLKETYPEYRIHLFKTLSELAFREGQDYWGWRFMGWGLHYMADLSMPYHSTVLPGYSTLRMLFINFLDILGFPGPVNNALQLVSNRHMAIERYQRIRLEDAWRRQDMEHATLAALTAPRELPAYSDDMPRTCLARHSNRLAACLDRAIAAYMPWEFVSDPTVELVGREDLDQIVEMIEEAHGARALERLDALNADAIASFAVYGRSYVLAILAN